MEKLQLFLGRYLDFSPPELVIAKATRKVLQELFSVDIEETSITVKEKTIYVSVDGILKSEIAFNKERILKRISEVVGRGSPDIR
jgi:hypothetical protein